ncbi:winged helix-turn-helix domain-containing protein [Bradyrhizobium liaoningense]|uniref:winged helix-turn-helix domain-containing protein n=1 Tax=Bradyrhizobium liaoningense TaxID=43992 RepID=UPI001BAD16B5|nr:winged helix-turn-helix domain-containing protein [Bradyrhizobium liaoningense]MBR0907826.1 winged helix-turn-helix domain-containing protein [Bradyrhizobium liaoningense]
MQTNELVPVRIPDQQDIVGQVLYMPTSQSPEALKFGRYCLIPGRRLLLDGQHQVKLGGRAFDILALLVKRSGEVVTHRQILDQVWQDLTVSESSIRVQVSDLRRALASNCERFIVTVPTKGYVFVAPVQHLTCCKNTILT